MIDLIIGDNSFERERLITSIKSDFNGEITIVDGDSVKVGDLPDLLMGVSLFSTQRLVIIKSLSDNKDVWGVFSNWIDKVSDGVRLVLVEPGVDKRTATYKALKQNSTLHELSAWGDRDKALAEKWVASEANHRGVPIGASEVRLLVDRVGVDQWQLHYALEKLVGIEDVNQAVIEELIDKNPSNNVFEVLSLAVSGDLLALKRNLDALKLDQDPFQLHALLSSQVFQLVALKVAGADDSPNKDFGIHPFVASKLKSLSRSKTSGQIKAMVATLARADIELKSSSLDPWLIVESAILRMAQSSN